jgi:hypothetical protein
MKNFYTFFLLIFASHTGMAQVPNSDFESWDSTAGYKVPMEWDNMNPLTASASVFTCERNYRGTDGAFYLALTSRTVTGMGVVPGVAVSGKFDPVTHAPASGFPFAARPEVLAGKWLYMAMDGGDHGYISVLLTKWNISSGSRDTVANTFYVLPSMVMSWKPFKIALDYQSTETPDSAMIVLSASGSDFMPILDGSYLWVDELKLTDSATLRTQNLPGNDNSFSLFPNPAKGNFILSYNKLAKSMVAVYIQDIAGRTIRAMDFSGDKGKNEFFINAAGITKGLYFVKLVDEEGIQTKKIVVE